MNTTEKKYIKYNKQYYKKNNNKNEKQIQKLLLIFTRTPDVST